MRFALFFLLQEVQLHSDGNVMQFSEHALRITVVLSLYTKNMQLKLRYNPIVFSICYVHSPLLDIHIITRSLGIKRAKCGSCRYPPSPPSPKTKGVNENKRIEFKTLVHHQFVLRCLHLVLLFISQVKLQRLI